MEANLNIHDNKSGDPRGSTEAVREDQSGASKNLEGGISYKAGQVAKLFQGFISKNSGYLSKMNRYSSISFPWSIDPRGGPSFWEEAFNTTSGDLSMSKTYIGYRYYKTFSRNQECSRLVLSATVLHTRRKHRLPKRTRHIIWKCTIAPKRKLGKILRFLDQENKPEIFVTGSYIYVNLHKDYIKAYNDTYKRHPNFQKFLNILCFEELIHLFESLLIPQKLMDRAIAEIKLCKRVSVEIIKFYWDRKCQDASPGFLHYEFARAVVQEDLLNTVSEYVLRESAPQNIPPRKEAFHKAKELLLTPGSANLQIIEQLKAAILQVCEPKELLNWKG